jgi:CubicO group peptidase (beta-lactamase class C family)
VDGAERLAGELEDQLRRGWHSAAQVVLLHRGEVILDGAAGKAGVCAGPVTPETAFRVFSIGKSILALCIHHLAEHGRISLDDPIAAHWPEFGYAGKEGCTVRHALLHQSGLGKHGALRQLGPFATWEGIVARLERARPDFTPGTKTAYQPLNYGFLLGELLRRVTGQTPQAYLEEHFLHPLGLRATTWSPTDSQIAEAPRIEAPDLGQAPAAWLFNRGYLRRRTIPAFNLYSSARDLAVLFQMLVSGGTCRGVRCLSADTVREATALRFRGLDLTVGRETLWATGFHLGGFKPEHAWRPGPAMGVRSTPATFGHCGHMSSIVWADPEAQLVLAFTCNGLLSPSNAALRWQRLSDLAWDAALGPA